MTLLKDDSPDVLYTCILEGDLTTYKSSSRSSYLSCLVLRKPVLNGSELNVWGLDDPVKHLELLN